MSSSIAKVHTEVKPQRINFIWSIKRFDLLPEDIGECVYSPWFYWENNTEKWRLQFYPRVERNDSSEEFDGCPLFDPDDSEKFIDDVSIYLTRESPGKSHIDVHTECKVFKGNEILKTASFTRRYGPQDTYGYVKSLKESKLFTTKSSNDQLTISCIIDTTTEVIASSFDAELSNLKKGQLKDDFRLLLEEPKFSDLTIIVGNQKFPVHKNILAQRSSFFELLQYTHLYDVQNKEMRIKNIEPNVMRGILEFIYTDEVSNIKEFASDLFEAANDYNLEKLRIMCEKVLHEELNEENAAQVLMLADRHGAERLKKYALEFIVDHAPEVIKSNNWKNNPIGKKPELLLKLFDQLALSQAAESEKSRKDNNSKF